MGTEGTKQEWQKSSRAQILFTVFVQRSASRAPLSHWVLSDVTETEGFITAQTKSKD